MAQYLLLLDVYVVDEVLEVVRNSKRQWDRSFFGRNHRPLGRVPLLRIILRNVMEPIKPQSLWDDAYILGEARILGPSALVYIPRAMKCTRSNDLIVLADYNEGPCVMWLVKGTLDLLFIRSI